MLSNIAFWGNIMLRILVLCACTALIYTADTALAQVLDPIDYSNQPQFVTSTPLSSGDAIEVVTLGRTAYVAVEDLGFVVVDWSNPANPVAGVEVSLTNGTRSLDLGNAALYVLDGLGHLEVFDLTDPLMPLALGQVPGIAEANDIRVHGDHAYVVLVSGGVQVVDLADPLAPMAGAQVALENGNQAMAVDGDRAYVVGIGHLDGDFGVVHGLDLIDPVLPVPISYFGTSETGHPFSQDKYLDVCASESGLFIVHQHSWWDEEANEGGWSTKLRRFDIHENGSVDPVEVVATGLESMAGFAGHNYVVAASREGFHDHLTVIATNGSLENQPIYDLPLEGEPNSVTWVDDYLLIACNEAGLAILSGPMLSPDYSEPLVPTVPYDEVHGEWATLSGDRMAVFTHTSFEGAGYIWIGVYDLVDGEPQQAGLFAGQSQFGFLMPMVFVGENHLYANGFIFLLGENIEPIGSFGSGMMTCLGIAHDHLVSFQSGSLLTWDVTDPEMPIQVDDLSLDYDQIRDSCIHQDLVYLVTDTDVEIVRVADDGSLIHTSSLMVNYTPRKVACNGSLLTVSDNAGSIWIYTLASGMDWALVDQLEMGSVCGLDLGTQLYVAVCGFGWAVVDVTSGASPEVIGWICSGGGPRDVQADSDVLALVDDSRGKVYLARQSIPSTMVAVPDQTPIQLQGTQLINIQDAWPNPANPRISVAFELSRAATIEAEVIDLAGRRVATLAVGPRTAGRHVLQWDGRGDAGRDEASGVYLIRVHAGSESAVRKVLLAR